MMIEQEGAAVARPCWNESQRYMSQTVCGYQAERVRVWRCR